MSQFINQTRGGCVVAAHVECADSFLRRAVGLLGRRSLAPGMGLWLTPCKAVHTWGMRFALDLVFLDHEQRVVSIARNIQPWRMVVGATGSSSVLEFATGWLSPDAVRCGDQLVWGARQG